MLVLFTEDLSRFRSDDAGEWALVGIQYAIFAMATLLSNGHDAPGGERLRVDRLFAGVGDVRQSAVKLSPKASKASALRS